jgi:filamentous hemagglutinin
MLTEHWGSTVATESTVARKFVDEHGVFEVRESLFMGPSGKAAKFQSTFEVMGDGTRRLTTIIPFTSGAKNKEVSKW